MERMFGGFPREVLPNRLNEYLMREDFRIPAAER
jgi:hypothetical protein